MRIGIDCRLSGIEHAGLGRYTFCLTRNLLDLDLKTTWVLFFAHNKQAQEFRKYKNVEIVIAPIKHYSWSEQWQMNLIFQKANLDLLHVPHFNVPILYPKPMVITIHDLLWHTQKGLAVTTLHPALYWFKYLFYRVVVWCAITKALIIFVPSQTVASTLQSFYPQTRSKTIVTYEGVSAVEPQKVSFKLPAKYMLYVGSLYPHKNVDITFEALKQLNINLVVVSSRSNFTQKFLDRVKKANLQDKVLLLTKLADPVLQTIYQKAYCVIQPSFSEGFGLTGLEAIKAGTPLIASNIPVFHEIYQSSAVYFDPKDPSNLITALTKIKHNRLQLKKHNQSLLKFYNWKKTAKQTLDAYLNSLSHINNLKIT